MTFDWDVALLTGTVMMFFPTTPHPQPADMNWSVVMYGAVTGVLLAFYFTRAKHFYQGPVTQVMSEETSGSETHARGSVVGHAVSRGPPNDLLKGIGSLVKRLGRLKF